MSGRDFHRILGVLSFLALLFPIHDEAEGAENELKITRVLVSPSQPQSSKCCFEIAVWVQNLGNLPSEEFDLWVYIRQWPPPPSDARGSYVALDHGTGQPITVRAGIPAGNEMLIYSRGDWVVSYPGWNEVIVTIDSKDGMTITENNTGFESW